MKTQNSYTVTDPWGLTYTFHTILLGEAEELIKEHNGKELAQFKKLRAYGSVYLLDNGMVISTSYIDATLYDSFAAFLSNLHTSGLFIIRHLPNTYPIHRIQHLPGGGKVYYQAISEEEAKVIYDVGEHTELKTGPWKSHYRFADAFLLPDGRVITSNGIENIVFESERDYRKVFEFFDYKQQQGVQIAENPFGHSSLMAGRNPYGRDFPSYAEALSDRLPKILNAPRKLFNFQINNLPAIDKHLYKHLFTDEFVDKALLSLLAYIGITHIRNLGGEWQMIYDEIFNTWLPTIRTAEGKVRHMYHQLLVILVSPDAGNAYLPLTTVLYS